MIKYLQINVSLVRMFCQFESSGRSCSVTVHYFRSSNPFGYINYYWVRLKYHTWGTAQYFANSYAFWEIVSVMYRPMIKYVNGNWIWSQQIGRLKIYRNNFCFIDKLQSMCCYHKYNISAFTWKLPVFHIFLFADWNFWCISFSLLNRKTGTFVFPAIFRCTVNRPHVLLGTSDSAGFILAAEISERSYMTVNYWFPNTICISISTQRTIYGHAQ